MLAIKLLFTSAIIPFYKGDASTLSLRRRVAEAAATYGRRNFTDTSRLMSSLLVIFVWGGEAILLVLNLVRNRV